MGVRNSWTDRDRIFAQRGSTGTSAIAPFYMDVGMREEPLVFHNERTAMLIKKTTGIPFSEVTDERLYFRRREFIQLGAGLAGAAIGGVLAARGPCAPDAASAHAPPPAMPQPPAPHT